MSKQTIIKLVMKKTIADIATIRRGVQCLLHECTMKININSGTVLRTVSVKGKVMVGDRGLILHY